MRMSDTFGTVQTPKSVETLRGKTRRDEAAANAAANL
jgi:hypothetical protein